MRRENGEESDDEGEDADGEEDWGREEGATYVTSDGDILPAPSSFRVVRGESSTASGGHADAPVEPSKDEIERLATRKRDLSE